MTFRGSDRMQYETPPEGISLTGYVVRRLHKTRLLSKFTESQDDAEKLAYFGLFAAAISTSWGPAYYQPRFDPVGTRITEDDPDTGASVTVSLVARDPHFRFELSITMPNGDTIEGHESILGTTVGLRGLGMPAPSYFEYASKDNDYKASASGIITSELVPGFIITRTKIRGYGELELSDTKGYKGKLTLNRSAELTIDITHTAQEDKRFKLKIP